MSGNAKPGFFAAKGERPCGGDHAQIRRKAIMIRFILIGS
jgi:hypothetical protein